MPRKSETVSLSDNPRAFVARGTIEAFSTPLMRRILTIVAHIGLFSCFSLPNRQPPIVTTFEADILHRIY